METWWYVWFYTWYKLYVWRYTWYIVYAACVWFIHGMVAWLIHLSTLVRESVLSFLQPFLVQTKKKKMTPPPFTACAKMHKWHKPHFAPDARKDKFKLSLLTVKCNFNCLLSEKVSKHLYSQKIYSNKALHFLSEKIDRHAKTSSAVHWRSAASPFCNESFVSSVSTLSLSAAGMNLKLQDWIYSRHQTLKALAGKCD